MERDYCFNLYTKKTKGSLRNERKWQIILILVSNIIFFDQKCLQSKKEYSNRQRLKKILTQAKGKQEERKYQTNYCCL